MTDKAIRPIPADDRGYSVDPEGIVHSRYAAHAIGYPRTRSMVGVVAILGRLIGEPCATCYPPPPPARPRRPAPHESRTVFTFPDGTVGPGRWNPKTGTVEPEPIVEPGEPKPGPE